MSNEHVSAPGPTPGAPDHEGALAAGRHPVIIGHLVMGVAFLGLLLVWALVQGGAVEGRDIRFLLPLPWVLAGVAGLAALVASDRRRHSRRRVGWVDTPPPTPEPSRTPEDPSSTMEG